MARGERAGLDRRGIRTAMKSAETAKTIAAVADQVADNVAAQGLTASDGTRVTATVTSYTTDRAAASVAIADPWGLPMQAKYGVLTRAAAAAGLEVTKT